MFPGSCSRVSKLSRKIYTVRCASCFWRSTTRRSKTCCTRTPLPGYCPLFFCPSPSVPLLLSPSSFLLPLSLFFCESLMRVLPCDLCSTQSAYRLIRKSINCNQLQLCCIMTLLQYACLDSRLLATVSATTRHMCKHKYALYTDSWLFPNPTSLFSFRKTLSLCW